MFRQLSLLVCAAAIPGPAGAHALFPGTQKVQTVSERAFARFEAVNGRQDTAEFAVEIFDMNWRPSRIAVPMPSRIVVPSGGAQENEAVTRPFSVLIDLDGKPAQQLRVCTKSLFTQTKLRPQAPKVSTRVCANVTVERFDP